MPTNLPVIIDNRNDGTTLFSPVNNNPIVLVLGTASKGDSETLFRVDNISDAALNFGKTSGTLSRGLYEVSNAGALNIRLFRVGATAATLAGVGKTPTLAGFTVDTVRKDDSAGTDYKVLYDASAARIKVYRTADDVLVFDNDPAYPTQAVDLGEVTVAGIAGDDAQFGDVGTVISGVNGALTLADAQDVYVTLGGTGPVFTAGTDGINLSRMQLWESLYNAYELLEDQQSDVVVPMNVYLDDLNIQDIGQAAFASRNLAAIGGSGQTYPGASDTDDVLGKVFVEDFEGRNFFWWWFPSDTDSVDLDNLFVGDSGANIFPSAGSATALLKTDGTTLLGSDFHEVNFAYQLADFCYTQSRDSNDMTGVVGVLPPDSFGLKDVSLWIGKLPTTTTDSAGNTVVSVNGTGLLGNKWMSGRINDTVLGTLGLTINGISGLFEGGFIATDTGFLDDAQQRDDNDHQVDIGKYVSIVAAWPTLSNPSKTVAYSATAAPSYGGFYSTLSAESAPTNKAIRNLRLAFRVGTTKVDLLAGQRYVMFLEKRKGIVVADAPTAARSDSDYRRLSTVRQVKAAVDEIRRVGEPFLGEGLNGARLAALDTAIDNGLRALVKRGVLTRYQHQVSSTPAQRVQGKAVVELILVPAFELRRITINISLSAV